MLLDTLTFKTAVDLKGWDTGIESASRLVEQFERRVASIRPPALQFNAESGNTPAADLAAAFIPASTQIRGALQGAFAGLEPVFRRLAVQVEALTGASLAHFRRLDSEVRFPLFMGAITRLRSFVQGQFDSMEGRPLQFARAADKALGGISFVAKLKNQLEGLRSFTGNSARELARLKLPPVVAAPAVAGVTALKSSAERAGGAFRGLGLQIAGALGLVGVAYKGVNFLREAIKNASDLGEQINKTNVILGSAAPAVHRFADGMAKDFGSSRAETLGVATEIAGLGKGLGKLDGKALSDFSTRLTQLAADTASIDNKGIKEIGDAFRIGLSGEQSDVLKGLGIVLNETTVKSYALSHGLSRIGQEMSEEGKVMSRAGIITESLAFANGDLARTINDPANAYRRFTGQVENLGASLGTSFLPVVNEVLAGLNGLAGGTEAALGRSQTSFQEWASSGAFAVSTISLYLQNWDDTVQIATLSAQQTLLGFAARIENYFGGIAADITNAIEHPFQALRDEVALTWLQTKNFASNIKELAAKGFGAQLVDINAGWQGGARPPARPANAAPDLTAEMAKLAERIEARRAVKPVAPPEAPPRPNQAVAAVDAKKLEKAQRELEDFARSFKDKIRRPFEEYADVMKKARAALDANLITPDQFKRADAFARKEAGLDGVPKFAGAQSLGSAEAYSTIVAAMSSRGGEFGQVARQTLRVGQEQLAEFRKLNKSLSARNDPVVLEKAFI